VENYYIQLNYSASTLAAYSSEVALNNCRMGDVLLNFCLSDDIRHIQGCMAIDEIVPFIGASTAFLTSPMSAPPSRELPGG
jgi:hypothetical protein